MIDTQVKIETYQEYLEECQKVQVQFASWRPGQVMFNVLSEQRPDLSEQIKQTDLDPFYADHHPHRREMITAFLGWVRENW
jgi:hypothetical protein